MANIVENLLGIFGSKKDGTEKKGKYFLELNEGADPLPSQVAAKVEAAVSQVGDTVSKAVDAVKPQVEEVASQVGDTVSKAVDTVKPQVGAAAAQIGDTASQIADTVKSDSSKDKKGKRPSVKDKATKKQEAAATQSQPAAAPKAAKPAEPEIVTFAPNYFNTAFNTTSRRRPGPSLNNFKDMAKDVGTRKK